MTWATHALGCVYPSHLAVTFVYVQLLVLTYQFARTPLAILDVTAARRLSPSSPVRRVIDFGFGALDLTAGRLLDDENLIRQGSERLRRNTSAAHGAPEPGAAQNVPVEPDPVATQAQAKRRTATKAKQHDAARSNQSLKTIQQRLRTTEAVAEAREHQDASD